VAVLAGLSFGRTVTYTAHDIGRIALPEAAYSASIPSNRRSEFRSWITTAATASLAKERIRRVPVPNFFHSRIILIRQVPVRTKVKMTHAFI
jgi:hypothetical protein